MTTELDRERASCLYQMAHRMMSGDVVKEQMARQLAQYRKEDSKPFSSSFVTNPNNNPGDDALIS